MTAALALPVALEIAFWALIIFGGVKMRATLRKFRAEILAVAIGATTAVVAVQVILATCTLHMSL